MRGESRHVPSRPRPAGRATGRAASGAAGLDLESVRAAAAGRRRLLRVVVDADGGPGLDDIANVSRSLSAELDNSGVMGEIAYTLEVSSPGAPGYPDTVLGRVVMGRPDGVVLEIGGQRLEFGYQELGPGQVQVEFG